MARGGGRFPNEWMWAYAARLLEETERLHRSFFDPVGPAARVPSWRPPMDVYEHDGHLIVVVALPGVRPEHLSVVVEDGAVTVRGERHVPLRQESVLHRLEIPHGMFERRLALPPGRYELTQQAMADGCLQLMFRKGSA